MVAKEFYCYGTNGPNSRHIQDMAQVEAYRFLFHKNYGKLAAGKLIEEMTFTCRKSHPAYVSSSGRNF